jgi:hypothetical protein
MTDSPLITNSQNRNETKDALEAYQIFRTARSFFFWIMLLCLIILQIMFWIVNQGKIDAVLNFNSDQSQSVFVHHTHQMPSAVANWPTDNDSPEPDTKRQQNTIQDFDNFIRITMKIFNTLICFMVILYCLSLLTSINLRIVGRLGGLADSTKAFFLSLFVMALILPWQPLITGRTSVTLFSYQELIQRYLASTTYISSLSLESIVYYSRFVGCSLATTLLLFATQWRSSRATRQTIRKGQTHQQTIPPAPENHTHNDTIPLNSEKE